MYRYCACVLATYTALGFISYPYVRWIPLLTPENDNFLFFHLDPLQCVVPESRFLDSCSPTLIRPQYADERPTSPYHIAHVYVIPKPYCALILYCLRNKFTFFFYRVAKILINACLLRWPPSQGIPSLNAPPNSLVFTSDRVPYEK